MNIIKLFMILFILFSKLLSSEYTFEKKSQVYLFDGTIYSMYSSPSTWSAYIDKNEILVNKKYLNVLTDNEREKYITLLKKGFDPESESYRYRISFVYQEEYTGLFIDRVVVNSLRKPMYYIDAVCYENLQYPKFKNENIKLFYKWLNADTVILTNDNKTKFITIKILDINECRVDINTIQSSTEPIGNDASIPTNVNKAK